jgi:hypothetical protein
MNSFDQFDQTKLLSMMSLQQHRLEQPHQIVTFKNFDDRQDHGLFDRHQRQVMLRPGETKEVDIISSEIPGWVERGRPTGERGFFDVGDRRAGQPIPQLPLRIIAGI